MESLQEVIDVLAERTPDEIRDFLLFVDCKGVRGKSCHCPIAKYVKKFTGEVFAVTSFHISSMTSLVQIDNPDSVADFIYAFDNGRYPELEIRN